MTVDEMKVLYERVMGVVSTIGPYTVRLWDGMDGCWCDVVTGVDLETALRTWCARTENGTEKISYSNLDYFRIFPADTKMLWSGANTMRGVDE